MNKPITAKVEELLMRGVAEVIDRAHLAQRIVNGDKLRLKFGIDPTGARLHLGHAVPLRALRRFQELGHTVVLIIGDVTARVGDPSGRNETRPPLTELEIKKNYTTYEQQTFKIIDTNHTEVHWQSEWFKKFGLQHILEEASKLSAGWILSHETFRERMQKKRPLSFHELLYPLLQAYDSVAIKADVEFGGLDQKFNLLTGRELMKAHGVEPQDVVLTKYLIGTDGRKMGKSLNNFIALEEEPFEMFGKVMSMPDTVLRDYFELATDVPMGDLAKMHFEGTEARNTKMFLARKIVEQYHGTTASQAALRKWDAFVKGQGPTQHIEHPQGMLRDIVIQAGLAKSKSEAQRLFEQGGVKLDRAVERDWRKSISAFSKGSHALEVGKQRKRFTFKV